MDAKIKGHMLIIHNSARICEGVIMCEFMCTRLQLLLKGYVFNESFIRMFTQAIE